MGVCSRCRNRCENWKAGRLITHRKQGNTQGSHCSPHPSALSGNPHWAEGKCAWAQSNTVGNACLSDIRAKCSHKPKMSFSAIHSSHISSWRSIQWLSVRNYWLVKRKRLHHVLAWKLLSRCWNSAVEGEWNLSLTVDSDDNAALNLKDLRAAAFFASDTGLALRLQLITGSVLTLRRTLGSILGPVVL